MPQPQRNATSLNCKEFSFADLIQLQTLAHSFSTFQLYIPNLYMVHQHNTHWCCHNYQFTSCWAVDETCSFCFSLQISNLCSFSVSAYPVEVCADVSLRMHWVRDGEHPLLILNVHLKFLLASCFCLAAFISIPRYANCISLNLKQSMTLCWSRTVSISHCKSEVWKYVLLFSFLKLFRPH